MQNILNINKRFSESLERLVRPHFEDKNNTIKDAKPFYLHSKYIQCMYIFQEKF